MEMKIKWSNLQEIKDKKVRLFAELFATKKSNDIVSNIHTEVRVINVNNEFEFPVTINNEAIENSFVCSPYTAYGLYAKDELKHKIKSKIIQYPLLVLIKLIAFLLRKGKIDKNIHINNFLLSTNPYPDWSGEHSAPLTAFLKSEFPKHALIFRSLNRYQHTSLIQELEKNEYLKLGSRQVYIYDESFEVWQKLKQNKHDRRIIQRKSLTQLSHQEMFPYLEDALALYNLLYLVKYSKFNPQFTLKYFQYCHENELVHFQGFIDKEGKLKAFTGLFILGNTITSPLVGYDTQAPQKEGLYIHAINSIMQYKFNHNLLLNLSSGAPKFKRLRGGKPSVEYSLVYIKHLTFFRRFTWSVIIFISNKIGVPLLEKYEL